MKSKNRRELHRFPLSLLHYGNSYYIERIAALERALARKPRQLQIDMLGEGEIPPDWALLIRSILKQHAAQTRVITNARSSLQNGSVLVGRVIEVPTLRQFGLAENDKWDAFLATAFAPAERSDEVRASKAKRVASPAKSSQSVQVQQ